MKKILIVLSVIFGGYSIAVANPADAIHICRVENTSPLEFQIAGLISDSFGWDIASGGGGFEGDTLQVVAGENNSIQVVYWWTDEAGQDFTGELIGNAGSPVCGEQSPAGWQPGAPSIKIPAPGSGPYTLEIQDAYGNWSLVTDQAHPDGIVLFNNGGSVELIGSAGQDINPTHYRLIPHS